MRRQELEITLSRSIQSFANPKFELEQYQTPPRVAANLLHRAYELGDLNEKQVIDVCSGTGILGLGAYLLGAKVTCLEIDESAVSILNNNIDNMEVDIQVKPLDLFDYSDENWYDTVLCNPPFGIQQRKYRDMDFIVKSMSFARIGYFILDGSQSNIDRIPKLIEKKGIELLEMYRDEFPLDRTYPWHKLRKKIHQVLIVRLKS